MARGFLSGAIWGTVVAGLGVASMSVLTTMSEAPAPEAAALEVPAGSEFDQARRDDAAALPGQEPGPQTGATPMVTAPQPDDLGQMAAADTDPGAAPKAGQAPTGMDAPGAAVPTGAGLPIEAQVDAPVRAGGKAVAPEAPQSEANLSISTDPAQPRPPEPVGEGGAFADEPAAGGAGPAVLSDPPDEPSAPQAGAENAAAADVKVATEPVETVDVSAKPETPREEIVIRVEAEPVPRMEPQAVVPAGPAPEPAPKPAEIAVVEPEPAPEPAAKPRPEVKSDDETSGAEPGAIVRIGKPASSLKDLGTGVATGRLPSVGTTTAETGDAAQSPDADVDRSALPPIERFAASFEDTENKSKMAIVLIDDGNSPVGLEALTTFPYPLSFAIDTSRADAGDRMAIFRAAGFEVLAMVNLPRGAAPSDVEVVMQTLMARVPEAVAVMESPGDGIQSDRMVSDQVTAIMAQTGHGLLLFSKGLNTAQKLAAKLGVRSATVFRDFDASGQNASTIRRFLNHAALKADSEGGVVMVGRMRADTVTALLLWGLQERANQVTLAPISQLLRAQ